MRFQWAIGGGFSDFLIHNIDECCWMKEAWPVEAKGSGGRHYRNEYVDQNFDSYSVEYTFEDGSQDAAETAAPCPTAIKSSLLVAWHKGFCGLSRPLRTLLPNARSTKVRRWSRAS